MTNKPMLSVEQGLIEKAMLACFEAGHGITHDELRALLDKPSTCAKSQVEGKRERFQKWVMATKHPVYGFLDGRSLARGDDRTGYADEYVQGLWVAYLEFGAEQPAPVAVDAEILERFPEINFANYGQDEVEALQAWAFEAYEAIARLTGVKP